jgi:omega-hydroxy-beta-dihydromenaquinone-9 sulfotransferase
MSEPARLLLGSRALAEWIRQGGRPERRVPAYAARLRWHAWWFEHNWRAELRRLDAAPLPANPVFILGLWRSGTTVMHELLAACTRWLTPLTWQCFNPSTCFLTPAPSAGAPATRRPMDEGRIAIGSPQEDEFALLLLGEPSLYRAFIDPRRLSECATELFDAPSRRLPRWERFVSGLAAAAPGTRLLLKSPTHSFRVPLLRALFPRAQFVWIGRQTGEVLASNARMWQAMTELYGLWRGSNQGFDAFIERMLDACRAALGGCLREVPQQQLLWVDFEELHTQPAQVLQRTLTFLDARSANGDTVDLAHIHQVLAQIPLHSGVRAPLPSGAGIRELEDVMAAARRQFGG